MSTEIKNTLFRFVTMRSPELSDEKQKDKRFIFRKALNSELDYPFDDAVAERGSKSKWKAMQDCPFTESLTENAVKLLSQQLYELGMWIARNKYSFTTAELLQKIQLVESSNDLDDSTLNLLWNNLFYQVVMEKDFYAKEAIMQMLIAKHVFDNKALLISEDEIIQAKGISNPVLDTELIKNVVNAKVVLPRELFKEDEITVGSALSKGTLSDVEAITENDPSQDMKVFFEVSTAQKNTEQLIQLKKELLKVEKAYKKEYAAAYDKAYDQYQKEIEPILVKYSNELNEQKLAWCSTRNPEVVYDPNDPCNQPKVVPYPNLPKFVFVFRSEIDLLFLEEYLSVSSFETLLKLLEIELIKDEEGKTVASDEDVDYSFYDTYSLIQSSLAVNDQKIMNNTPSQSTTFVSIGGVIVPTAYASKLASFSFELCPNSNGSTTRLDFILKIEVPDSTYVVKESGSYHHLIGSSLGTNGLFFVSRSGNSIILRTNVNYPFSDDNTATSFDATITFTNGVVKTLSVPTSKANSIFRSCFSGILKGNDSGTGSTEDSSPTSFIPSGFGVKQLGIADYKKVEQTVQGYIEGDVAHIENIMAREYKEKATRKLRRSENTTTKSSESEKEQLSDTTTSDRFEMQSEVAKVLQESKDFSAGAGVEYTGIPSTTLSANVNFAAHSSKEESNRQAIMQAKDVTERAMERIVTKVKEERIEKIIEEFEENNKHGFDNTKGDKHVVGVFRWVDKVYKNQVLNYGKRLMFEFMVPEPAKLHILGMTEDKGLTKLIAPVDPRKYVDLPGTLPANFKKLTDYTSINETTVKYWASEFNVELNKIPDEFIFSNKSFASSKTGENESYEDKADIKIPEGYAAISAKLKLSAVWDHDNGQRHSVNISFGNQNLYVQGKKNDLTENDLIGKLPEYTLDNYVENMTVSYSVLNYLAFSIGLSVKLKLQSQVKVEWQQNTFNTIIKAYEDAVTRHEQKLAEEGAKGIIIRGSNPGFYRQMENLILRKNCISYIVDQNDNAKHTYGRDMFKPAITGVTTDFTNLEVNVSPDLDDYSAFVKFMEQAFEWEIMSYYFYPYYWGAKKDWSQMYQYDNNDPLFRNFMQAGMARVIVTVRPGFEEAVNYYMQTGQIWNGGEVPVIDDKLFLSIVDELREPAGKKEGKAWATKLPTSLTILQADSIGLRVTKALPFDEDLSDFEDPSAVPVSHQLELEDTTLGNSNISRLVGKIEGNENIEAKIVLKNTDGTLRDLTYCDASGNWELSSIPAGNYELLLDANGDFPDTLFEVIDGSLTQLVEINANQTLEVNLVVHKL